MSTRVQPPQTHHLFKISWKWKSLASSSTILWNKTFIKGSGQWTEPRAEHTQSPYLHSQTNVILKSKAQEIDKITKQQVKSMDTRFKMTKPDHSNNEGQAGDRFSIMRMKASVNGIVVTHLTKSTERTRNSSEHSWKNSIPNLGVHEIHLQASHCISKVTRSHLTWINKAVYNIGILISVMYTAE